MYHLKLYITGETPASKRQIDHLHELLEKQFQSVYNLEIIDILEEPDKAYLDNIFATPTLIRQLPEPIKRVIGNLNNRDGILAGLDLIEMND